MGTGSLGGFFLPGLSGGPPEGLLRLPLLFPLCCLLCFSFFPSPSLLSSLSFETGKPRASLRLHLLLKSGAPTCNRTFSLTKAGMGKRTGYICNCPNSKGHPTPGCPSLWTITEREGSQTSHLSPTPMAQGADCTCRAGQGWLFQKIQREPVHWGGRRWGATLGDSLGIPLLIEEDPQGYAIFTLQMSYHGSVTPPIRAEPHPLGLAANGQQPQGA